MQRDYKLFDIYHWFDELSAAVEDFKSSFLIYPVAVGFHPETLRRVALLANSSSQGILIEHDTGVERPNDEFAELSFISLSNRPRLEVWHSEDMIKDGFCLLCLNPDGGEEDDGELAPKTNDVRAQSA